jgi:hypothetical protein
LLIFPFVIVLLSTFFEYGIYIDALDTSDLAQIKEPFNDYVNWDNQIFYILSFNKVNFLHKKLSKLFIANKFFYLAEFNGYHLVFHSSHILHNFLGNQFIPWIKNCDICSCQHRFKSEQKGNEPATYKKYNYFGKYL